MTKYCRESCGICNYNGYLYNNLNTIYGPNKHNRIVNIDNMYDINSNLNSLNDINSNLYSLNSINPNYNGLNNINPSYNLLNNINPNLNGFNSLNSIDNNNKLNFNEINEIENSNSGYNQFDKINMPFFNKKSLQKKHEQQSIKTKNSINDLKSTNLTAKGKKN